MRATTSAPSFIPATATGRSSGSRRRRRCSRPSSSVPAPRPIGSLPSCTACIPRSRASFPSDGGGYPAGTPYSAHDPELMLWTIAVAAESAACFYELLVRPFGEGERDAFWNDWVRFGELFGMPSEVAPASWGEFREWFDGRVDGDDIGLTEEARHVGRGVAFRIPVPRVEAPAMEVHNLLLLGSLPPRVRSLYGLPWDARREIVYRASTRAVRASRPFSPKVAGPGSQRGSLRPRRADRGRPDRGRAAADPASGSLGSRLRALAEFVPHRRSSRARSSRSKIPFGTLASEPSCRSTSLSSMPTRSPASIA